MAHPAPSRLAGYHVLIVEDEYFLAADLAAALGAAGAHVLGPVNSPRAAAAALDARVPDLAILDMNLRGASSLPVAERLQALGVPFLILSGFERTALPDTLAAAPLCRKPALSEEVLRRLAALLPAPAAC